MALTFSTQFGVICRVSGSSHVCQPDVEAIDRQYKAQCISYRSRGLFLQVLAFGRQFTHCIDDPCVGVALEAVVKQNRSQFGPVFDVRIDYSGHFEYVVVAGHHIVVFSLESSRLNYLCLSWNQSFVRLDSRQSIIKLFDSFSLEDISINF